MGTGMLAEDLDLMVSRGPSQPLTLCDSVIARGKRRVEGEKKKHMGVKNECREGAKVELEGNRLLVTS